jgi:hypothetical protein
VPDSRSARRSDTRRRCRPASDAWRARSWSGAAADGAPARDVLGAELCSLVIREAVPSAVRVPSNERMTNGFLSSEPVAEFQTGNSERFGDFIWGGILHDHALHHTQHCSKTPQRPTAVPNRRTSSRSVVANPIVGSESSRRWKRSLCVGRASRSLRWSAARDPPSRSSAETLRAPTNAGMWSSASRTRRLSSSRP